MGGHGIGDGCRLGIGIAREDGFVLKISYSGRYWRILNFQPGGISWLNLGGLKFLAEKRSVRYY